MAETSNCREYQVATNRTMSRCGKPVAFKCPRCKLQMCEPCADKYQRLCENCKKCYLNPIGKGSDYLKWSHAKLVGACRYLNGEELKAVRQALSELSRPLIRGNIANKKAREIEDDIGVDIDRSRW